MTRLFIAFILLIGFLCPVIESYTLLASAQGVSLDETLRRSGVKPEEISNLPTLNLGTEKDPVKAVESVLLDYVINPIFLLSGGVAVVMILYSSFLIITARGQEEGLTSAKTTLMWAFVGLGLIMLSYTIVINLARIISQVL